MSPETVQINKKALVDLVRLREEFDAVIESMELMADKDFMASYEKAQEQIKKREFDDWDGL